MGLFRTKNKDDKKILKQEKKETKKQERKAKIDAFYENSIYIKQAFESSTMSFGGVYAYDSKTNKLIIPKLINLKQHYDEIILDDIISFDISNNGEVSEKFNIGLGVAGGLVLGPLGMLGALMKKKSSTISELSVRLYTKDGMYKVPFIQRKMKPTEATERLQATETLTNLIKENISSKAVIENSNNTAASALSIADELKKLSDLKDQGILTTDEFNDQKAKLLSK